MKNIAIFIFSSFLALSLVAQDDFPGTPPEGGTPKGFDLPSKKESALDNGLKSVRVQWGAIPKADIRMIVKTGNIHEGENQVWLSDVMADMMKEGTQNMSAGEIADKMAAMGGNLSVVAGTHAFYISASVLYEYVPDAINLMAEVLKNPAFPQKELDRIISDKKRSLSVSQSRPQPKAFEAFFETLFPDHPYGNYFPTEEMLDAYTLEDVQNFYDRNIGAQRTTVYLAGKFDDASAQEAIEKSFSDWRQGPVADYPLANPDPKSTYQILDRPDAPQTTIVMGLPVIDPSHEDYVKLDVTNSLLGGSFASRITSNIREDKGYTYSPRSAISDRYRTALWYESADVTTDVTGPALREITKEIQKLQKEAPSQEELDGIQNYEAGIFVLQNSTPGGIISQLSTLDIYNLPETYLTERVDRIYAVTPEDVRKVTEKYIRPEDMTIILVGDKDVIESQIKSYEKEFMDQ